MRIATWNVNSLPARIDKVGWWLERAQPDVLLLQETKLADAAAPHDRFAEWGYTLAHHGEGRWNGVAIASRVGLTDVVTNFGEPVPPGGPVAGADGAGAEARMIAATCGGVRVVAVYAPNGRALGTPFYDAKLGWFERLHRWLVEVGDPAAPWVVGGDFNVAPTDLDVWDAAACHGGTHVSAPERERLGRLTGWGLVDVYRAVHPEPERYSWWDYRAGMFHKNYGMRIDLMLASRAVADRVVGAEIDREARKGKPTPSDHAPVSIDLDAPGVPFDADGMTAAHRTLPFGTIVLVTRTDTGAKVRVVVNDRGPYSGGRVIDLSEAAARALGMTDDGTAPVKIAVVGCDPGYPACN
ncbi:MAG: exodeoxyribonuclease III [Myxococcota bacterium]